MRGTHSITFTGPVTVPFEALRIGEWFVLDTEVGVKIENEKALFFAPVMVEGIKSGVLVRPVEVELRVAG